MPRINLGPDVPRTGMHEGRTSEVAAWYVDVCEHCWNEVSRQNSGLRKSLVSHPPYEKQSSATECWLCQAELGAADNDTSVIPEGAPFVVMAAPA